MSAIFTNPILFGIAALKILLVGMALVGVVVNLIAKICN